jgi:hypothetical protein
MHFGPQMNQVFREEAGIQNTKVTPPVTEVADGGRGHHMPGN